MPTNMKTFMHDKSQNAAKILTLLLFLWLNHSIVTKKPEGELRKVCCVLLY